MGWVGGVELNRVRKWEQAWFRDRIGKQVKVRLG